ncbi:uncharacterized protein [Rutidosis leptorrhynchoides]|uniref:uncharacterized protein n=1 Tax=Rutidosis leptorrhynchoides TaxID=125765 RepID=UPI003A9A4B24
MAHKLMDQIKEINKEKVASEAKTNDHKRKGNENRDRNHNYQHHHKKQEVSQGVSSRRNQNTYQGKQLQCQKCKRHHFGNCTVVCKNCNKVGHHIQNCRFPLTDVNKAALEAVICYGCGKKGHYKNKCPNQKRENGPATKLYCFVHKVPVCGECICFQDHRICVVGTYSAWVIDGDYDWPTKCCRCQAVLQDDDESQTTRLGCLHIIHTDCLVVHIKGFPSNTTPDGYVCPACSISIWPPKNVKNSGSRLYSQLKEAIRQSGNEKNLFGNHPISSPPKHSTNGPPPAFDSDPLRSKVVTVNASFKLSTIDTVKKDDPVSEKSNNEPSFSKSPNSGGSGATTRKSTPPADKQASEFCNHADDEDTNKRKYTRRGSFRLKILRWLIPFWSSGLPSLPVTTPPKRDANENEIHTRPHRPSRMDPRKILIFIAIMACMATMGILYHSIAQRGFWMEMGDNGQQLPLF